jgi:glycosyltransferase involved in cell wall biosynthesis
MARRGGTELKIALYHGYELSGSGSNEYTRYLIKTWVKQGHEVVIICAERPPEPFDFLDSAYHYGRDGQQTPLFDRASGEGKVSFHRLPYVGVYPVYVTDKQRAGVVKSFCHLSEDERRSYHQAMALVLRRVLEQEGPDILHCNHLIYQPIVAAEICPSMKIPFYIVPHGSSIEYVVKRDERYRGLAESALEKCAGIVWIAREVRDRTLALYPKLKGHLSKKEVLIGIGTDTSLFQPIERSRRSRSVNELRRLLRPGGKSFIQSRELRERLSRGMVNAVREYWNAYNHSLEDEDLGVRLQEINSHDYWLIFLGALTYGKGIQSLIIAMPLILEACPDTQLFIVGSGTYREYLEALVFCLETKQSLLLQALVRRGQSFESGIGDGALEDVKQFLSKKKNLRRVISNGPLVKDRIHFCGRLDHSRLKHLFPCCDLAVFPSLIKEASPLVMVEALANGVLPSGANHSGLRGGLDELSDLIPSRLLESMRLPAETGQRVEGLSQQIPDLLLSSDRLKLSGSLRKIAVDNYDWTKIAAELADAARDFSKAKLNP